MTKNEQTILELNLYSIRQLIEVASQDHPEDYNLAECLRKIDGTIREVEHE